MSGNFWIDLTFVRSLIIPTGMHCLEKTKTNLGSEERKHRIMDLHEHGAIIN